MSASAGAPHNIPSLDGVRAIAILMVLAGHALNERVDLAPAILGNFGVTLFFVLSGYLITRSMLHDESRYGKLRIRNFYFRRVLRIFPAFYVFLAVIGILSAAGALPKFPAITWVASAAFFRNMAGGGWDTIHLWSLSLEEQFYLFWPAVFILVRPRRLSFIAAAVVIFTAWRAIWLHNHQDNFAIAEAGGFYYRPDFRLDTFLIGAAFAIADWQWVKRAPMLAVLAIIVLWFPFAVGIPVLRPLDTAVTALLLAVSIGWLVGNPQSGAARYLSSPPLVTIGLLSYSLYLWQELFLGPHFAWWSFPALALVSCASYRFVERPALKLRNRVTGGWAAEPSTIETGVGTS